jgi:hypothetical protein
MIGLFKKA